MLAIIQSRYNSTRLPGKALLPLGNSNVLGKCIERVSQAKLITEIIVATSDEHSDFVISEYCKKRSLTCYTGSLIDVGSRLANAVASKNGENFVRICGDSPFIDPVIIDQAVSLSHSSEFDLVTNVFPRSFPKGQSVEVIRTETMQQICSKKRSADEKEHATSYFYVNHHKYRICSFSSGADEADSRQCIDDENDYKIAKNLMELNETNDLCWKEIQRLWNAQKN